MTIVTDAHGKLVGAVMGHALSSKHGELEAQVSFPDGQNLHRVDVRRIWPRSPIRPSSSSDC